MLNKAAKLGKKSVWLKVNRSNQRAVYLYKKYGFSVEKETEVELIMRIQL